ncbi:hypothetical protein DL98DRAFT_621493 [Cadophora sp. DSE1049]|nr:hypothetical protein DL98DRAFT_621493 [Cadophora sp. DSE1049]
MVVSNNQRKSLTYLKWQNIYQTVKLYQALMEVPKGVTHSNLVFENGPEELIKDVRGRESLFNLDDNGFTFKKHQFVTQALFTKDKIESVYLQEVHDLIKNEIPGADEMFVFNWQLMRNVRTADEAKTDKKDGDQIYLDDSMEWIKPVNHVHVGDLLDQTPGATEKRIRYHMGDKAEKLLRCRYRIFNGVKIQDCVGVDHIWRRYVGESNYPLYSPGYNCYFLSGQTKDEVIIFKTHDSSKAAKAMCRFLMLDYETRLTT